MTDSATTSHATIHPSPTDNDNGDSTCIASTPPVKQPIIGDASLDILSDSAHHGEHAMPDVQRDNQRPAQNRMAVDSILESNPLENLNNLSANYQKQSDIYDNLIENVAAGESHGIPADRPVESSFERIDELAQNNDKIIQNVESEIDRANRRHAHIVEHQEQAAERRKEAKNKPLRFIANGSKSTVYTIPETFGGCVIVVGPLTAIKQELRNILHVEQAWKKVYNSIWSGPRPYWLTPLSLPRVSKFVPTGWTEDLATGLVRPCENLNPRIHEFYYANGDRMPVDCDEHTGIVLSQIRGLADDDHENILRRCYGLEDPEIGEVLSSSDHCVVRIYLGRKSDDGRLDNAGASDATMEDVLDDTSITTTSDYESLSTFNLPVYIDHVIRYCNSSVKRQHRVLAAFAREIAFGYAVLHWGARLDARGIEFLLGSSPTGQGKRFYMLDFEDCRPIDELNDRCVRDQLVPAALENDPYIPRAIFHRPDGDGQFWERQARDYWGYTPTCYQDFVWWVFVKDYLEASDKIFEAFNANSHLPKLFIEELMKGFLGRRPEEDDKGTLDGESDHPVASKDETHYQAEQGDVAESEQGESGSQEDSEHDGGDEDDQIQDDSDSFESDRYEDDEYDSDPMSIDVSSEGEEDSDEDDDDDDDVD